MALFDAWLLDNSGPTDVARVHNRETEYREWPEVKARYARQYAEWVERNREHLKAYKREYAQRADVRQRRLRYGRGYRQRPEVIEKERRAKTLRAGRPTEEWRTVSLDAEVTRQHTAPRSKISREFHEVVGVEAEDPLRVLLEESSEAQGILAGITEDEIDQMADQDLARLRERLLDAGVAPKTQHVKRARERQLRASAGKKWRN